MLPHRMRIYRQTTALVLFVSMVRIGVADDSSETSIEQERLKTMKSHVMDIRFYARREGFPERLQDQPLFRYDDLTRGYVDGTVWRLGESGRPQAIVTSELHPSYAGQPRIVCDYLSLSDAPFMADVIAGTTWMPKGSAVKMEPVPNGPPLAGNRALRLFQLKKMAERFTAHQTVEGQELELRLLPRHIDRYQPSDGDNSDAAIFLFVSGRNPGIVLLIEAVNGNWQYGVGRLSGPSTLSLSLDGNRVWQVEPSQYVWTASYTAANYPIVIP
jgi:hypothetical protein